MRGRFAGAALGLALGFALVVPAAGSPAKGTGFAPDPREPLVTAQCTACHSAALVTQMRASRDTWESLIRWMQNTQNLWTFPPETEATILDYLAEHYGPPARAGRRAPLPASLLPPGVAQTR